MIAKNEEHAILQRQAYIRADVYRNVGGGYKENITSREDRRKMDLPNRSSYNKWLLKFQHKTMPKSPREFRKTKSLVIFNKPEIRITSEDTHPLNPRIKKPRALTIDNEVYEAICSSTPTRLVLVTSPRKILLPPPKEGSWSYRTTKF